MECRGRKPNLPLFQIFVTTKSFDWKLFIETKGFKLRYTICQAMPDQRCLSFLPRRAVSFVRTMPDPRETLKKAAANAAAEILIFKIVVLCCRVVSRIFG